MDPTLDARSNVNRAIGKIAGILSARGKVSHGLAAFLLTVSNFAVMLP
ncbi:MAG: hypothetical protein NTZ14_12830 [Hyphomicrobiales bacterium]|nr:hypothetical protein [Hyphomicrobiales bacterium]